ncbi:hypothetical protein B0H19DRAFT_1284887 [Mycena capillaripes]|nr:hypothetical protein B0H19DRAFT_1284887 [Mycena capillaripes]
MALSGNHHVHVSGGTFNNVAGHLNQYQINGDFIQSKGDSGIHILRNHISAEVFHDSEQRYPPPRCHPYTRMEVRKLLESWMDDGTSTSMWLHGPAGAGKSAIAQSMADSWKMQGKLGAAFFFAKWRTGGGSAERLFPTIAYQLAMAMPHFRVQLGLALESDPAIPERTLEEQAYNLIRRPLQAVGTQGRYVVVIDGLDECDGKPKQGRIIQILAQLVAEEDFPMRFLVCSRPEPHLREAFESNPARSRFESIALDERFKPSRDIMHYLRVRFEDIRRRSTESVFIPHIWPSEQDLETLVQKASGQFIYPETVLKFVDDEYSHPVERLRLVLAISSNSKHASAFSDLDALYTLILSSNPDTPLIVQILGAYFFLPNPDDGQ